ncbi:hypothetical protein [Sulfurivermis fontis]|jgi:hypothetical protein|uniref:hypothetical protein n=1 Tax=Sulfurivermis fontis TaxID=1972068 RepID=UPI000FDC227E|nr:hypothetical protein [Sulfurivermis fontis]
MRRITLVYKLKSDGQPCRACGELLASLRRGGQRAYIDRMVAADERDPAGEGWELARRYGARSAPFFIVEQDATTRVYTDYPQLLREVLHAAPRPGSAATAGVRSS